MSFTVPLWTYQDLAIQKQKHGIALQLLFQSILITQVIKGPCGLIFENWDGELKKTKRSRLFHRP